MADNKTSRLRIAKKSIFARNPLLDFIIEILHRCNIRLYPYPIPALSRRSMIRIISLILLQVFLFSDFSLPISYSYALVPALETSKTSRDAGTNNATDVVMAYIQMLLGASQRGNRKAIDIIIREAQGIFGAKGFTVKGVNLNENDYFVVVKTGEETKIRKFTYDEVDAKQYVYAEGEVTQAETSLVLAKVDTMAASAIAQATAGQPTTKFQTMETPTTIRPVSRQTTTAQARATKAETAVAASSEDRYIRDRANKEAYLRIEAAGHRLISPSLEDFEQFQILYKEVQDILKQLLITQGLNPDAYRFYLVDTMEPNAAVMRYYNVMFVNIGLLRLLTKQKGSRDSIAFVLAHEVIHIQQQRDEVDRSKADESKGIIDTHIQDRAWEWEADLRALALMDKAGFTVREAPVFFKALLDWMQARKLDRSPWGNHPDLEERLRALERQILGYHWKNYITDLTFLSDSAIEQAPRRTRHCMFQEQVIHVKTSQELNILLEKAATPEELQFALLVGHEILPKSEQAMAVFRQTFEKRLNELAGDNRAKQVLYTYMRDEIYVMLGYASDNGRLDAFNTLAAQLDPQVILELIELGIPPLFAMRIDVDPTDRDAQHRKAETILNHLTSSVTSLSGRQMPSDRFNMYGSGFIHAMTKILLGRLQTRELSLSDARRLLAGLLNLQTEVNFTGVVQGSLWISPNIDFLITFMLESADYAPHLTPDDIHMFIRRYEQASGYERTTPKTAAEYLHTFAQRASPDTRQAVLDWLMQGEKSSELRNEFINWDIQRFTETGEALLGRGTPADYLNALLGIDYVVKYYPEAFKLFLTQAANKKVSDEELVRFHRAIFGKFREAKVLNDAYIHMTMYMRIHSDDTTFNGDVFDQTLSQAVDPSIRDMVGKARRELKPLLYVYALGGMLGTSGLREFVFGQISYRQKKVSLFAEPEIAMLIARAEPEYKLSDQPENLIAQLEGRSDVPDELIEHLEERYQALSRQDQGKIIERWNIINPQISENRVHDNEFKLLVAFFDTLRNDLSARLAPEDASDKEREQAFGNYAAPIYLQYLFYSIGHGVRLSERDARYADSAWDAFSGDISLEGVSWKAEQVDEASKQRPRRATRLQVKDVAMADWLNLFKFIKLLPSAEEEAIEILVRTLPPTVFRNFTLYFLVIGRLNQQLRLGLREEDYFDLRVVQNRLATLPASEYSRVVTSLKQIIPHLVYDEVINQANQGTFAKYALEKRRAKQGEQQPDEATLRSNHAREILSYEEVLYTIPGGPLAQLQIFLGRLADRELESIISSQVGLEVKRTAILDFYPEPSAARDLWLKKALESSDGLVEHIEATLRLFANKSLRDIYALRVLERLYTERPEDFGNLETTLIHIQRLFPDASPLRDDILAETAQRLATTPEAYAQIVALLMDPFQQPERLREKEVARVAFGHDLFRSIVKGRSPQEKAELLLWLMGLTSEKPFFLVDIEYEFHINFDSLRDQVVPEPSRLYPSAGMTAQREFLEPFLYGEQGLFSKETAAHHFLDGLFNALVPPSAHRGIIKAIYDAVFSNADAYRREEMLIALTHALGSQRQELESGLSSEVREARVIRIFLESVGLAGVKLGQVLARSPIVPKTMRQELAHLQDQARPVNKGVIFDLIQKLYGNFGDKFIAIGKPIGSASIKVVYKAVLKDGREVALKVKRPEIEKRIKEDLDFLRVVLDAIQPYLKAQGIAIPSRLLSKIETIIKEELDFKQEQINSQRLRANLTKRNITKRLGNELFMRVINLFIPSPKQTYTITVPDILEVANNTLLIEEFVSGISLTNEAALQAAGLDPEDLNRAAAREFLRQLFIDGFYHADPHAGNALASDSILNLIDVGAASEISFRNRVQLARIILAITRRNASELNTLIKSFAGTINTELAGALKSHVLNSNENLATRTLWFFQLMEDANATIPSDLLSVFRFMGAGAALFEEAAASASTLEIISITPPSVGSTEGYVNEAILRAHSELQKGKITAQEAAHNILQAIRTMPEPEYIVNIKTAIDILKAADSPFLKPALEVLGKYSHLTDHNGLQQEIRAAELRQLSEMLKDPKANAQELVIPKEKTEYYKADAIRAGGGWSDTLWNSVGNYNDTVFEITQNGKRVFAIAVKDKKQAGLYIIDETGRISRLESREFEGVQGAQGTIFGTVSITLTPMKYEIPGFSEIQATLSVINNTDTETTILQVPMHRLQEMLGITPELAIPGTFYYRDFTVEQLEALIAKPESLVATPPDADRDRQQARINANLILMRNEGFRKGIAQALIASGVKLEDFEAYLNTARRGMDIGDSEARVRDVYLGALQRLEVDLLYMDVVAKIEMENAVLVKMRELEKETAEIKSKSASKQLVVPSPAAASEDWISFDGRVYPLKNPHLPLSFKLGKRLVNFVFRDGHFMVLDGPDILAVLDKKGPHILRGYNITITITDKTMVLTNNEPAIQMLPLAFDVHEASLVRAMAMLLEDETKFDDAVGLLKEQSVDTHVTPESAMRFINAFIEYLEASLTRNESRIKATKFSQALNILIGRVPVDLFKTYFSAPGSAQRSLETTDKLELLKTLAAQAAGLVKLDANKPYGIIKSDLRIAPVTFRIGETNFVIFPFWGSGYYLANLYDQRKARTLKGKITLGHAGDNAVVAEDDYVSGRHAEIEEQGGEFIFTDLGSRNGTEGYFSIEEVRLVKAMVMLLNGGQIDNAIKALKGESLFEPINPVEASIYLRARREYKKAGSKKGQVVSSFYQMRERLRGELEKEKNEDLLMRYFKAENSAQITIAMRHKRQWLETLEAKFTPAVVETVAFHLTEQPADSKSPLMAHAGETYEVIADGKSFATAKAIKEDYCDKAENHEDITVHGVIVRVANNITETGFTADEIRQMLEDEFTEDGIKQLSPKDDPLRIVAVDKSPGAVLGGNCVGDKLVLLNKGLNKITDERARRIMAQATLRHEIRRHELTGQGKEAHTPENDKDDIDYLISTAKENGFENLQDFVNAIERTLSKTELYKMLQAQGESTSITYKEATHALNRADNILTHELTRSAEATMELLNEALHLVDVAEGFPGLLYEFEIGDRKRGIPILRKRISEKKKAVEFELRVKTIARETGRPFIDITEFLAPNFEEDEPINLIGHATNFGSLYEIVFESDGIVIPQGPNDPIYINFGGRGQAARVRILSKPGLVPIVWDKQKLDEAGIVIEKTGEGRIYQPTPLRFATARSKCYMWQILLSILEAYGEELTPERQSKIATALGYQKYSAMTSELSPELDAVFAVSSLPRPIATQALSFQGLIFDKIAQSRVRAILEVVNTANEGIPIVKERGINDVNQHQWKYFHSKSGRFNIYASEELAVEPLVQELEKFVARLGGLFNINVTNLEEVKIVITPLDYLEGITAAYYDRGTRTIIIPFDEISRFLREEMSHWFTWSMVKEVQSPFVMLSEGIAYWAAYEADTEHTDNYHIKIAALREYYQETQQKLELVSEFEEYAVYGMIGAHLFHRIHAVYGLNKVVELWSAATRADENMTLQELFVQVELDYNTVEKDWRESIPITQTAEAPAAFHLTNQPADSESPLMAHALKEDEGTMAVKELKTEEEAEPRTLTTAEEVSGYYGAENMHTTVEVKVGKDTVNVRIAKNINEAKLTTGAIEKMLQRQVDFLLQKGISADEIREALEGELIVAADKLPNGALGGDCRKNKLVLLSKGLKEIKDNNARLAMADATLYHENSKHELTGQGDEAHTPVNDEDDINYLISTAKENGFENLQDFIDAIVPTLYNTELFNRLFRQAAAVTKAVAKEQAIEAETPVKFAGPITEGPSLVFGKKGESPKESILNAIKSGKINTIEIGFDSRAEGKDGLNKFGLALLDPLASDIDSVLKEIREAAGERVSIRVHLPWCAITDKADVHRDLTIERDLEYFEKALQLTKDVGAKTALFHINWVLSEDELNFILELVKKAHKDGITLISENGFAAIPGQEYKSLFDVFQSSLYINPAVYVEQVGRIVERVRGLGEEYLGSFAVGFDTAHAALAYIQRETPEMEEAIKVAEKAGHVYIFPGMSDADKIREHVLNAAEEIVKFARERGIVVGEVHLAQPIIPEDGKPIVSGDAHKRLLDGNGVFTRGDFVKMANILRGETTIFIQEVSNGEFQPLTKESAAEDMYNNVARNRDIRGNLKRASKNTRGVNEITITLSPDTLRNTADLTNTIEALKGTVKKIHLVVYVTSGLEGHDHEEYEDYLKRRFSNQLGFPIDVDISLEEGDIKSAEGIKDIASLQKEGIQVIITDGLTPEQAGQIEENLKGKVGENTFVVIRQQGSERPFFLSWFFNDEKPQTVSIFTDTDADSIIGTSDISGFMQAFEAYRQQI